MKLIKQGAEARLYLDKHDDAEIIIKDRIKKSYRVSQIDQKIRKTRTTQESTLLSAARRAGISTPQIFQVNSNKILMEHIPGKRIKELFTSLDKPFLRKFSEEIGRSVGKLHSAGIIHGDLTTSNMILHKEKIYFIDFGLGFFSRKIEDQGTDLRLLREALISTHFSIQKICWDNFLKGYRKEYKDADKVLRKVSEIGKRARYT